VSHFYNHLWVSVAPSMHTLFGVPVGHGQCRVHSPSKCLALSISFNLFVLFVNGSVTNGLLKMKAFMMYKTRFVFIQRTMFYVKLYYPRLTFWHRSFTFNSNKSPTCCNSFSVYYPEVCLQLNMFRAFSRPSSGAQ
jgi:hypothetical protein